ncbi:MAG: hypothetical protein IJZ37_02990 [Clostridia bacterium]|nr:hypothetical protein [Clostridia bacterium]
MEKGKRAQDLWQICEKRGFAAGEFLTPEERKDYEGAFRALKKERSLLYFFTGGVHGAARTLPVVLCPDYEGCAPEDFAEITPLYITLTDGSVPEHRAVLGSLMALGLKRSVIGEIFKYEKGCVVMLKEQIVPYVCTELTRIGRAAVQIQKDFSLPTDFLLVYEKEELHHSVSSLRLDCIVSALTKVGREQAADYIKKGFANVNFEEVARPDKKLLPGDTLSLRGFGRYVLSEEEPKQTKSGRLHLTVFKYK